MQDLLLDTSLSGWQPLFNMQTLIEYRLCWLGLAWLQYKEEFRMRAVNNLALPWDQVQQQQLWLQVMVQAKPNQGDRSDSGHLVQRLFGYSGPHTTVAQSVQSWLNSWEFTSQGMSARKIKYKHECPMCVGPHDYSVCTKGKAE